MFRAFACLTEQHDLGLVGLAVAVSWLTNFVAFRLLQQASAPGTTNAIHWRVGAGAAVGAGIWCTHFIAMLGYDPGIVVGYAPAQTLVSLSVAVVVAASGLALLGPQGAHRETLGAGFVIALGIATMHYIGMAGVQIPGYFRWDTEGVVLSVIAGAVLAPLALVTFHHRLTPRPAVAAATLLTAAIGAVHFIGMGAAEAVHDPSVSTQADGLPRAALVGTVTAVAFAVLAFAALALAIIAERLREEKETKAAQLDVALSNMSQGLCLFDAENRLVLSNDQFRAIYNLPDGAARPGTTFQQLIEACKAAGNFPAETAQDIHDSFLKATSATHSGSFRRSLADGRIGATTYKMIASGGWVATFEDVTERFTNEAKIAHLARHDALTGLLNRSGLRDQLDHALARVARGEKLSLLCLDLDRFKFVNDTLGHPAGDELLRQVADRLRLCVREIDTVARLGGDEFVILQVDTDEPQHSAAVARRVIKALAEPYDLSGQQAVIGASVGIALAPRDSQDPDRLLALADLALYQAKADGRGTYRFFEATMNVAVQERRSLEADLRTAMAEGGLSLHYQPVVEASSRRVVAFEALLRWLHPGRGWVAPDVFVPLAEEVGLIGQLGAWVLDQACRDASSWPATIRVAVNLSPAQFRRPELVRDVEGALARAGLPSQRLELEVTEGTVLQDTAANVRVLHRLRAIGVGIAMDDFGTGYSSLSYLRRFPFDKVKIDRSFIADLGAGREPEAIVLAITGMCQALGMVSTAEGVETAEQFAAVRRLGCKEAQGYLFSSPQPAEQVPALIARIEGNSREAA